MTSNTRNAASYKDPSGFIFRSRGRIYRQVNKVYAEHYSHFIHSGLSEVLTNKQLLLPYTEIKENILESADWLTTLLPEQLSYISYPYEWCFEQMKDAALLTLELVKAGIEKGMILKDATPFNIQFHNGRPVFIDTLSFEKYDEARPWVAYRQFCETFLFPLWLSHYHKTSFQPILAVYPDGIPVSLAAKLFPGRSRLNLYVWMHVHLQNKMSRKFRADNTFRRFSEKKLLNLITNLEEIVSGLDNSIKTEWSGYYDECISNPEYLRQKENVITRFLKQAKGKTVLDIGANKGHFSFIAAQQGFAVIAVENDEQCVNHLYKKIKKGRIATILPLCIDITNPSPAAGFADKERLSWNDRMLPDIILALAVVHHLVIGKNIPLSMLAEYLSQSAHQLIIEFVGKEDEKTQLLLLNRENIFQEYSKENFEVRFQCHFNIEAQYTIPGTARTIYLMDRKKQKDN